MIKKKSFPQVSASVIIPDLVFCHSFHTIFILISVSIRLNHFLCSSQRKPNPKDTLVFIDLNQIMWYLPTSCLVFFFLFSLLHHLSCASTKKELGWCEAIFECGNITAGFPFSGGSRPQFCGHPSLELHCFKNSTSIVISNHLYDVLHIDQTSKTLRLVRAELRGSFCTATFTTTTLPPEIFELSTTSQSLTVFYLCHRNLRYNSSYLCPDRGSISVSQNLNYHKSCQDSFTTNVLKSYVPEEKELNLKHLENALYEGFDVKVKIDEQTCEQCLSSQGICGFNNTTQICCKNDSSSRCNALHLPHIDVLHQRCSGPFRCGDQKELYYPFWRSERESCGHPDFKLDCSGEFAELNISSVKYRILSMSYGSPVISLGRSDYIGHLCPADTRDAPFDQSVLQITRDNDLLTLYYDCNSFSLPATTGSNFFGELGCEDDIGDRKSYYVTRNMSSPLPNEISGLIDKAICRRDVTIPVSINALKEMEGSPSPDSLEKALKQGFELEVSPDCSRCFKSGGACGYDQTSNRFVCYCEDKPHSSICRDEGFSTAAKAGTGSACGLVGVILIAVVLFCLFIWRRKTSDVPRQLNLKALMPLEHYSYAQVKRISKSFSEVVGKGGFGIVYRGTLCDGRKVAVKVLNDTTGNGEDFVNEVASMSKTSHVNIVTLLGFCAEGTKRAILYEFLENGSLDKFISSKRSSNMDWMELYGIALGVARGLEYLHHGCRTRIVHFDIKPQNVLLDGNLCPKVSDFGLAKLCERKESILSLLDTRGTIGYIAPEVFSRVYGRVSHKSDVYSYGMLVLEMIGARTKTSTEDTASSTSSVYFPEWIYKDLEKGHSGTPTGNVISNEEEEIAKKMTLVGLWCVQYSPSDRPPMNRVVEMMEGSLDALEVPPRPVLQIPTAPLPESSTVSEDISVYTEVCSMNIA
ncbi:LEAF RUST 10 DISEASE-RESISTANCE LOCUS RECEPTOR-LIKE PROTEIN KINASE-like 2.7 isoform X1 [Brassica rapa]|uniref:LEAF RUST 10 DISEASE-RESISTANCE LOCUS RECEPTOR-LIKE PROTEIN KINASE-like 2.7 isoform X1 n=1 Tax=Brassica campestris TaxID=3711 RepID=UPI0004F169C1|nr:LEAF RUST 10 DISEASE-RESISTANCE LOCUS RECEPTOR-LIKE PROTEIN KINASE-like 2.7 isoform X1 [Brassica rapa]